MIRHLIFLKPSTAACVFGLVLMAASGAADARGGRGFGHGFGHASGGQRGASFAGDHRHADDPYIKAASQEEEKLLAKLKNICRGC
jgi:hypothetical protein